MADLLRCSPSSTWWEAVLLLRALPVSGPGQVINRRVAIHTIFQGGLQLGPFGATGVDEEFAPVDPLLLALVVGPALLVIVLEADGDTAPGQLQRDDRGRRRHARAGAADGRQVAQAPLPGLGAAAAYEVPYLDPHDGGRDAARVFAAAVLAPVN